MKCWRLLVGPGENSKITAAGTTLGVARDWLPEADTAEHHKGLLADVLRRTCTNINSRELIWRKTRDRRLGRRSEDLTLDLLSRQAKGGYSSKR